MTENKKRHQVYSACVPCRNAHIACDNHRPCTHCVNKHTESSCVDVKRVHTGGRKKTKHLQQINESNENQLFIYVNPKEQFKQINGALSGQQSSQQVQQSQQIHHQHEIQQQQQQQQQQQFQQVQSLPLHYHFQQHPSQQQQQQQQVQSSTFQPTFQQQITMQIPIQQPTPIIQQSLVQQNIQLQSPLPLQPMQQYQQQPLLLTSHDAHGLIVQFQQDSSYPSLIQHPLQIFGSPEGYNEIDTLLQDTFVIPTQQLPQETIPSPIYSASPSSPISSLSLSPLSPLSPFSSGSASPSIGSPISIFFPSDALTLSSPEQVNEILSGSSSPNHVESEINEISDTSSDFSSNIISTITSSNLSSGESSSESSGNMDAMARELAQLKQCVALLQKQQQKQQRINFRNTLGYMSVGSNPSGIAVVSFLIPTGEVVECNRSFRKFFEVTKNMFSTSSFGIQQITPANKHEAQKALFKKYMLSPVKSLKGINTLCKISGLQVTLELVCTLSKPSDGPPVVTAIITIS